MVKEAYVVSESFLLQVQELYAGFLRFGTVLQSALPYLLFVLFFLFDVAYGDNSELFPATAVPYFFLLGALFFSLFLAGRIRCILAFFLLVGIVADLVVSPPSQTSLWGGVIAFSLSMAWWAFDVRKNTPVAERVVFQDERPLQEARERNKALDEEISSLKNMLMVKEKLNKRSRCDLEKGFEETQAKYVQLQQQFQEQKQCLDETRRELFIVQGREMVLSKKIVEHEQRALYISLHELSVCLDAAVLHEQASVCERDQQLCQAYESIITKMMYDQEEIPYATTSITSAHGLCQGSLLWHGGVQCQQYGADSGHHGGGR